MIYESHFWRKELLKIADRIEKRINSKRDWTETQHGVFERDIMIGFYMIRKLKDSFKLTNRLISTKIKGVKYASKAKVVHLQNAHKYLELYDFDNPQKEKFDFTFLTNQIVHSYIFNPQIDVNLSVIKEKIEAEKELTKEKFLSIVGDGAFVLLGIHFNSDATRNQWLYELSIDTVIGLFKKVGNCYITSIERIYNEKKKDFVVTQTDEIIELPKEVKIKHKRKK